MRNRQFSDDSFELSAYWDALLGGDGEPENVTLDRESIDFIAQFQRATRSEFPAGTGEQTLNAIMRELQTNLAHQNGKARNVETTIQAPGKAPAAVTRRTGTTQATHKPALWQQALSWVGAAAIIFAIIGGLYLTNKQGNNGFVPPLQVATPDATPASPDVPMYKANPGRTGVNPGPGPAGSPVALWTVKVGGQINSSPAIVGNVVYVGSDDGGLYALDKSTGATIWRFAATSAVNSSPAVVNGIAYAGSEDGTMYAVDTVTGKEVWRRSAASPNAGPVVEGGVLYTGAEDGYLYALDAATGAEIWKTPLGDAGSRSAAYANGVVYVCSADAVLHAVDAKNGSELWTYAGAAGTPVVSDDIVWQGGSTEGGTFFLAGLDAKTGTEIWRIETEEGLAPSAVSNGLMYSPSYDSSMYSLDATTGEQRWQFKTGDFNNAPPAIVGDILYFGSHDHHVYALNGATGDLLWSFETDGEIAFGPVVTGGVAYVGTFGGTLYAIGGSDDVSSQPVEVATMSPEASVVSSPASLVTTTELVWQTSGVSGNFAPGDIAVSPTGEIYAIDFDRNRIAIFSQDGVFKEWWGTTGSGTGEFSFSRTDWAAGDIDVDSAGNIYVFDSLNNRIQKFDPNRQFLFEWGSFGAENGQFNIPFGEVDVAHDRVLVPDVLNARIQVFDLEGKFLDKWGSYGKENGLFDQPIGVDVDAEGNVYVVEQYGYKIQKFDAGGRFISSFGGGRGLGPGQFGQTWDLVIDEAGNIYVADYDNNRIQVFNSDGAVIAIIDSVPGLSSAFDGVSTLEMDADGYLYVGDERNGRVVKLKITLPPN